VGTEHIVSRSPEDTYDLARILLARLPARAVLALHGDLGSGKTCFVQGLARALGIQRAVTSPTFTMINEYPGPRPLCHIDLYRIHGPDEALSLGLEEYLHADGITAIEWAERAGDLIPRQAFHLHFERTSDPDERAIRLVCPD
jgi:tRNA threonylcarbamoyladenosine biosynthesis protein TsaE